MKKLIILAVLGICSVAGLLYAGTHNGIAKDHDAVMAYRWLVAAISGVTIYVLYEIRQKIVTARKIKQFPQTE